jgi:hypothetical protein
MLRLKTGQEFDQKIDLFLSVIPFFGAAFVEEISIRFFTLKDVIGSSGQPYLLE